MNVNLLLSSTFYAVAKTCFEGSYYLRHVCVLIEELMSKFSQDLVLRSSVDAFKCWLESVKNNGTLHACLRLERGTLSVEIEKIIRTIIYEMLILIRVFKLKTTEEYTSPPIAQYYKNPVSWILVILCN